MEKGPGKEKAKKKVEEYIIQRDTLKPVMPQRNWQGKISSAEGLLTFYNFYFANNFFASHIC